jgi:hypothetical protein
MAGKSHLCSAASRDDVDNSGGKAVAEERQSGPVAQHSCARHFHHDGVAHDQGRNESRIGLVKRVIERTYAENNPDGTATKLSSETTICVGISDSAWK